MHAALARKHRPLREGELLLVPVPHEDVLQAGGQRLVDGDVDDLALAGGADVVEGSERGDGGVGARGEEGELAQSP